MRCKKGSGEIRLEQVFDSISEFKEVVVDYALKNGENIKFTRWGSERSEVRCAIGGNCNFKIYCSYEDKIGKYMVKTCNDVHACTKDGFSKVIKSGVLAQLFLNDIRKDPTFKAKAMQDAVEERYTIVATYDQSNPGLTVDVGTMTDDNGVVKFDRFYVCFAALRKTWIAYCRPIIGIDGCFLNGVKGQLLVAVGRDANNQFYPVAWAVVQTENFDAWLWFIKKLKVDLTLENGDGFTLISDRQKGLLNAVDQELPKVEHRICARHICGNLRRVYPGKDLPKKLFWTVAKSFNEAEYNRAIEELKKFDEGLYDAVMQRNPQNCSRAFFGCKSSCEDVSNNFSESYNNAINKAREMPLVEMLETIRRQTMMHIDVRLKKAMKRQGKYTLKVANTIKEEERLRKYC
ncbi:PREDICTED: uncharacterized protein LOC104720348 [Camelina sativa]|uniref:Uncharacterized protein LOC104720348 n=1 Tax=Camelina sativa TaxID=90675 RepID=A0ABM0U6D0_CAMSA|nr:PREDICTED: uncharacterized protein LOC104720348 [Camelina sativa]